MATAPQAQPDQPEPKPNGGGDEPSGADRPTPVKKLGDLVKKLGDWLIFLAAVGALVIGVMLLWNIWRGRPLAEAFTRVGGATRVETAVAGTRFWLTPPQRVVITPAGASQQIMLEAARCAMVYDAPLLFTSPTRRQLVRATIERWRKAASGSARPIMIQDRTDVTRCLAKANLADVNELPTLSLPNRPFRLSRDAALAPLIFPDCTWPPPRIAFPARWAPPVGVFPACPKPPPPVAFSARARPAPLVAVPDDKLAPVVVFAAAKTLGHPPDVAVGEALAAHLATADRQVSLVVVPRYLEADPKLEGQLRRQRHVVEGGIVLGSARVLPADTRELLRQLLTSTDRQGLLDELRTNLGSVAPLIAALLAILGWGTAARKAPEIRRQAAGIGHLIANLTVDLTRAQGPGKDGTRNVDGSVPPESKPPLEADWLTALDLRDRQVTAWLRTGRKVTGIADDQYPAHKKRRRDGTVTRIRLKDATVTEPGEKEEGSGSANATEPGEKGSDSKQASGAKPVHKPTGMYVWVSVEDIELIGAEPQKAVSEASGAKPNQPASSTASQR